MTATTAILWLSAWAVAAAGLGGLSARLDRRARLAAIRAERRERGGDR